MVSAKLIDTIWATRKADCLNGLKFMLAEVENLEGPTQQMIVADIIGAGIGERVMVVQGSAARRMLGDDALPIDAAVIGIIDEACLVHNPLESRDG